MRGLGIVIGLTLVISGPALAQHDHVPALTLVHASDTIRVSTAFYGSSVTRGRPNTSTAWGLGPFVSANATSALFQRMRPTSEYTVSVTFDCLISEVPVSDLARIIPTRGFLAR
jgi:hypothetical protein